MSIEVSRSDLSEAVLLAKYVVGSTYHGDDIRENALKFILRVAAILEKHARRKQCAVHDFCSHCENCVLCGEVKAE